VEYTLALPSGGSAKSFRAGGTKGVGSRFWRPFSKWIGPYRNRLPIPPVSGPAVERYCGQPYNRNQRSSIYYP
jgi:hypothetical protein